MKTTTNNNEFTDWLQTHNSKNRNTEVVEYSAELVKTLHNKILNSRNSDNKEFLKRCCNIVTEMICDAKENTNIESLKNTISTQFNNLSRKSFEKDYSAYEL